MKNLQGKNLQMGSRLARSLLEGCLLMGIQHGVNLQEKPLTTSLPLSRLLVGSLLMESPLVDKLLMESLPMVNLL